MSEAQRLREIQERTEKATEGPWDAHYCSFVKREEPESACGIQSRGFCEEHDTSYPDICGDASYDECHHVMDADDAEFIANARVDIPFLLELVNRLKVED